MVEDRDSKKSIAQSQDTDRRFTTAKRNSVAWLLAIAAISGIVLAWAWSGSPSNNTLRFESAKTAMQVIAVASLGGLAALATFTFQRSRTREDELRDRRLEQRRRRDENRRDKRDRQDDLLRSLLRDTLTSYNRVKRVRRLVEAETKDKAGGHVTLDVYDKHMTSLNDEQLEFEKFKRLAPFIDDKRLNPSAGRDPSATHGTAPGGVSLKESYERIEKYLNKVIDEYEDNRHVVAAEPAGVPLAKLTKLSAFLQHDSFELGAAMQIDGIIDVLQKAVLQPPALPDPNDDDAPRDPFPELTRVTSDGLVVTFDTARSQEEWEIKLRKLR